MNTTINLDFGSPKVIALAGDKEGETIYTEQVDSVLTPEKWQREITICFPDSVVIIGSSFWMGFTKNMIQEIGYDGVCDRVKFVTSSDELTEELYDDLLWKYHYPYQHSHCFNFRINILSFRATP